MQITLHFSVALLVETDDLTLSKVLSLNTDEQVDTDLQLAPS